MLPYHRGATHAVRWNQGRQYGGGSGSMRLRFQILQKNYNFLRNVGEMITARATRDEHETESRNGFEMMLGAPSACLSWCACAGAQYAYAACCCACCDKYLYKVGGLTLMPRSTLSEAMIILAENDRARMPRT